MSTLWSDLDPHGLVIDLDRLDDSRRAARRRGIARRRRAVLTAQRLARTDTGQALGCALGIIAFWTVLLLTLVMAR